MVRRTPRTTCTTADVLGWRSATQSIRKTESFVPRGSGHPVHYPTSSTRSNLRSSTERGTRVAALFCSLIESVKLAGVEPRAYLGEAARRAVGSLGAVTLARYLKSPGSLRKIR